MSSQTVVIVEARSQDTRQMPFVDDDQLIKTFSANRADQSLHVWILPGTLPSTDDCLDTHALHSLLEDAAIDRVRSRIRNRGPSSVARWPTLVATRSTDSP